MGQQHFELSLFEFHALGIPLALSSLVEYQFDLLKLKVSSCCAGSGKHLAVACGSNAAKLVNVQAYLH